MTRLNLSFFPESEKAEKGVISYFRSKGVIDRFITTFGSEHYSSFFTSNILDLDPNHFYASSLGNIEQHVGLTFLHHSFVPISFTICQYNGAGYIPKTFDLEASLTTDGEDWKVISSQNSQEFCVVGLLPTFHIDRIHWKPFKRFRIVRKGLDCGGDTLFRLGGIELFGHYLFNPCTLCIKTRHVFSHILFFHFHSSKIVQKFFAKSDKITYIT